MICWLSPRSTRMSAPPGTPWALTIGEASLASWRKAVSTWAGSVMRTTTPSPWRPRPVKGILASRSDAPHVLDQVGQPARPSGPRCRPRAAGRSRPAGRGPRFSFFLGSQAGNVSSVFCGMTLGAENTRPKTAATRTRITFHRAELDHDRLPVGGARSGLGVVGRGRLALDADVLDLEP